MGHELRSIVMTPRGLHDSALAIAGSRAGAIGVLDIGLDTANERAVRALADLVRLGGAEIGVRLEAGADETAAAALLEQLPADSYVVLAVPAGAATSEWPSRLQRLARERGLRILAEVATGNEAAAAAASDVDGLVGKGSEAGGRAGDTTTFVLVQELLQRFTLPVWARGGIDVHPAAACAAAGATGVVLCEELALVRESTLPENVREAVAGMDGGETVVIGAELGSAFRFFKRSGCPGIDELKKQHDQAFAAGDLAAWQDVLLSASADSDGPIGWNADQAWPLGQNACFAASVAKRFVTTGGVVAGLKAAVAEHLELARRHAPIAAGSSLAKSHNTQYPIAQGPMTRVSDVAPFAAAVAEAGALPFIALALMRAPEVEVLLEQTKQQLGDRSWGVGILGFVPRELRDEQLAVVRSIRPRFALIAGGRPDQAAALEADGIATYIHVPSPKLLELFHAQGARRFVFEGGECGGHIGPRSSFVLWSQMVDRLLDVAGTKGLDDVHVLFAGGIHDARSAAMVSALAAPLAARNAKIGVLMGTAYLFTEEAVTSGAIVPGFQKVAIECTSTAVLETGPGHITRCAPTAFTDAFLDEKRRLLAESRPAEEVRESLEHLNLGKLRLAAKGVDRNAEYAPGTAAPKLILVDAERQAIEGMYMIGQVAALRDRVTTMADLHRSVSDGAQKLLSVLDVVSAPAVRVGAPRLDVAVVGMSCLLPGANDIPTFWDNVLNGFEATGEVPSERWDWRRYFDDNRAARDKVYSRWGGFLPEQPFDPLAYGMPPATLRSIEPLQLLTLEVVRAALKDAGMLDREFPRQRASVILGAGGGVADLGNHYAVRAALPQLFDGLPLDVWDRLPEWTEDSFPGLLLNVAAGRAANRFDLGGINMTVDAACASSLAAVYIAAQELAAGRSDVVFAGGVDTVQNPFGYLCFSKTQALSPRGKSRVFDASADGIVISEGLAVVVLKRRADAERDGDRIYAVLRGVGGSSDGRGRSMTAPRPDGQMRALDRAYEQAGYSPATVGLFEAHGTGTAAGDLAEAETLRRVLEGAGARRGSAAVGSVKSMIGHTKCAAGVTGLIKAALSLHRKVLPPTINVERPNPKAGFGEGPLYVNSELRPWIAGTSGHPRRASVSAFGFGGTNFHVALEEYTGDPPSLPQPATAGAWSSELLLFKGERAAIAERIGRLATQIEQGARPRLRDLARSCWETARRQHAGVTVAIVAADLESLPARLAALKGAVAAGTQVMDAAGAWYLPDSPKDGKLAMVFPGQGSQYPNMFRDLAVHFRPVREEIERAERVLAASFDRPLGEFLYPAPAFTPEERKNHETAIRGTRVAQPALGAVELGAVRLLSDLGIAPDLVAGHSYGEYVALAAAGVYTPDDLARVSEARGRSIVEAATRDLGTMAAVNAAPDTVSEVIAELQDVWIANYNAPLQTVISGSHDAIKAAIERFSARKIQAQQIPVACGFHSPLVADARTGFAKVLAETPTNAPNIPVYSNSTANEYPRDAGAVRALLSDHLVNPVRFAQQITAMYDAGARVFVEVGPKSVLSGLIERCLEGRPHLALALDRPGRSGIVQLQHVLGTLAATAVPVNLDPLFAGRDTRRLDLDRLDEETRKAPLPASTWMISGGRVRPIGEAIVASAPVQLTPRLAADTGDRQTDLRLESLPATPLPTVHAPVEEVRPVAMPYAPAGADALPVLQEFQRTMAQLIESQERVMLAYLSGSTTPASGPRTFDWPPTISEPIGVSVDPPTVVELPSPEPRVRPIAALPAEAAPAATPVASAPRLDHPQILASLLAIVVERTGYPKDLVDVEASLEADLGIDSIKRVEIIGELWRTVPHGFKEPVPGLMEDLTAASSLSKIAARMAAAVAGAQPQGRETTVRATTVATATVERITLADIQQCLLDIVVERTGYPKDLVDVEASLEADLGIDSIKRVEIIGELWRSVPHGFKEPVPGLMEDLTAASSLSKIAARMAAAVSGPAHDVVAAAPVPVAAVMTAPAGPSAADIRKRLLEIVVDRTGYPADLLDQDASLEADLGIDSIKRVEIIGELWRSFPHAGLEDRASGLMEELTSAKSLNAIVHKFAGVFAEPALSPPAPIVAAKAAESGPSETPASAAAAQSPKSQDQPLPRFVMKPMDVEVPRPATLPAGTVLVTDDGRGVAAALMLALRERGIEAELLQTADFDPSADREAAKATLEAAGEISAVVYLPSLTEASRPVETSPAAWRTRLRNETGCLFTLIQVVTPMLKETTEKVRPRLLCATTLGGDFGLGEHTGEPPLRASHGGLCGLTKTLAAERPDLAVKVVDLDERASDEGLAECLMLELLADDREVEVGWRLGHRSVPRPVAAPFRDRGQQVIDQDSVVLLTGGARGITAEIAFELAEQFRPTLVLLGRAGQPGPESAVTSGIATDQAGELKAAVAADRKRQGRPAALPEIEADYRRVLAEREMRATFDRLKASGARWEYISADVCSADDMDRAAANIRSKYGRLDAVLHGAGVIEDKLLSDKKWESFERVFETKAVSAHVLARTLAGFLPGLKFVAFFSSVAGAFANRGQADYVAGNEVANKLALVLNREWHQRGCRVVSLNWGPWQKGMASDGVQKQFRARGIEAIPVPAGRLAMIGELAATEGSPVIVLGEGPWGRLTATAKGFGSQYPMLATATRNGDGELSAERVIDLSIDHFIDDHRLDGRPVLPMTVALEMMSELAAARWPELTVTEVRNVAVLKGIVLSEQAGFREKVRLIARVVDGPSASGVTIQVEVRNGAHPELLHYRATVEMARSATTSNVHGPSRVRSEFPYSVADAYQQLLFHGHKFAHIEQIDGESERGLLARIRPSDPAACLTGGTGDWVIDPIVLDSGLQMVILWARTVHDVTPLPARFKRYRRYDRLRARGGGAIRCELVASADTEARLVHADLTFFDDDGTVVGVLEGLECTASRELNRLANGQAPAAAGDSLGVAVR